MYTLLNETVRKSLTREMNIRFSTIPGQIQVKLKVNPVTFSYEKYVGWSENTLGIQKKF